MVVIQLWADYVCPWCYLALDRVDHLTKRHGAEVTWQPYELHPATPPGGKPISPVAAVGSWLGAELASAGLEIRARATMSNSRAALEMSSALRGHPAWRRLHRALYRSYWVDGADVGDLGVLERVAASVGIAPETALAGVGRGDALAASKERAHDLGIGAVPGWHFGGGTVLTGAQPREAFDKVIRRLG